MADLKISQLPEVVGTPPSDSELIVNEANGVDFVTKRVAMGNLMGGVSVFEPQKLVMSEGPNSTGNSVIQYSTGQWLKRSPFVVGSSATQTVTLPEGATHCLIVWTTWNGWRYYQPANPSDTTSLRHLRQYVVHRLNMSGGTYVSSGGDGWIQAGYTHTVPYKPSLPQSSNDDYYSSKNKTKTKLIQMNPGNKTLSFDCEIKLTMGGGNKMQAYMGDLIILPMKVANTSVATALGTVISAYGASDEGIPDYNVTQEEAEKSNAIAQGNILRSRAKNLLDVIVDYRDSYEDITGGPLDSDLEGQLKRIEKRVHSVVFSSSKLNEDDTLTPLDTKDECEAEIAACNTLTNTLIMKPFKFEVDAGVNPFDVSF